jgi:hypothetical protein
MLITGDIVTVPISLRLAWQASFFNREDAGARILNRFNLRVRRLIIFPDVENIAATRGFPIAVLAFVLFAGKNSESNKGEGNGKFFHNG